MTSRKQAFFFLTLFILFAIPNAEAENYILKDANNFVELFSNNSNLSAEDIQKKYLDIGTKGIDIFTPSRIISANNLVAAVNNNKSDYEKAIKICLPSAQKLTTQANDMLKKTKNLLGQSTAAPVYILFGANNSGGTATKNGLSIGLEVLCRFAETEYEADELLLGFIAHELVHVYQSQSQTQLYSREITMKNSTLLKRSLVEGVADFVSFLALGKITKAESERHEYGIQNENEIWSSFKQTMHSTELGDWLYSQGENNKPNDMGYWVGKRIAESYYNNARNKTKALKELLLLEDPISLLLNSGYAPENI